jgi:hypothetical protein
MVAPLFYLEPSAKMFLSRSDRNLQPVFFRGKGTGAFFVICAEGVIGPIEIDQHLPSWHRFDKELTPLRIGFRSGGLSLKRKGEFPPPAQGSVNLEDIFFPYPIKFETTIFYIFFLCPLTGGKIGIKRLRVNRISFDGSNHRIVKIDWVVKETFEFLSVALLERRWGVPFKELILLSSKGFQFSPSSFHGVPSPIC